MTSPAHQHLHSGEPQPSFFQLQCSRGWSRALPISTPLLGVCELAMALGSSDRRERPRSGREGPGLGQRFSRCESVAQEPPEHWAGARHAQLPHGQGPAVLRPWMCAGFGRRHEKGGGDKATVNTRALC